RRTVSLSLHGTGLLLPPPPPGVVPSAPVVDRELPAGPPLPHASASAVPITNACRLIVPPPRNLSDTLQALRVWRLRPVQRARRVQTACRKSAAAGSTVVKG